LDVSVTRWRFIDVREYVPGGTRRVRTVGPVRAEAATVELALQRLYRDYPGHRFVRWTWDEVANRWRRHV